MPDGSALDGTIVSYLLGIGVLVSGAVFSWAIAPFVAGIDELLIAILFGVVLTNIVDLPDRIRRGIRTHKIWLGAGIVLMGSSLALDAVIANGTLVVASVFVVTAFTLLYVEALARVVFCARERFGSLLAAGSSICGVSAVVAVAGSIEAREEHIAYAAGTVLFFDAVTLIAYPTIGRLLDLPAQIFGMWAGLSMFSTGPVVAVGFEHSDAAGQWVTVTKLTRNALIGLVAVAYATYYARKRARTGEGADVTVRWRELWDRFPKFVLGFLALALVASAGAFSADQLQSMENAFGWLFLLAFVGLGTDLEIDELRQAGLRPVLIVLTAFLTLSLASLLGLLALVS